MGFYLVKIHMNQNAIISDNHRKEIAITLDNEMIAQIILEFLGKKETLVYKETSCPFLLRHNDLEQFHYLLIHKMQDQLNVVETHLTVDFNYSDKTTRTINGFEALQKLNEIRNVTIDSVTLTWKIVNKFFNHDHPTTQTIELSFDTKTEDIILTIAHTNQAWAIEIKNLFSNKIHEILKPNGKITKLYNQISKLTFSNISSYVLLLAMLSIIPMQFKEGIFKSSLISTTLSSFEDNYAKNDALLALMTVNIVKNEQAIATLKSTPLLEDKKIQEKLINNLEEYNHKYIKFMFSSIISLLCLILFPPLILIKYTKYAYAKIRNNTAIITNKFMEDKYDKLINSQKTIPFYGISFISFTIIIGLITNYLSAIFL